MSRGTLMPGVVGAVLMLLPPAAFADERPNIILMMADDLGWGDPSYNGGWIDTPALDAMAAAGLRFDRFYAASAVCSPTRASCLTGRNPMRLGIPTANSGRLAADETPLSDVLVAAGYTTGHFGKWHLGTLTTSRADSNRGAPGNSGVYSPPWHHGYDTCFATEAKVPTFHPMRRTQNGLPEPLDFADPNFYGTYYWTPPAVRADWPTAAEGTPVAVDDNLSGDDSRVIMDRVIPFVRGAVADGDPFLAVVWFHTPHKPLPDPDGLTNVDSADAYTDAIVGMDSQIARMRAELEDLGIAGDTMFWFCSDNGPENGVGRSGPFRERKRSLHEGGVRVPGILVWPEKIPVGRVTVFPAVTSDYYPTILDYLGIEVGAQKPIDGISLRKVIDDDATVREQPIGFRFGQHRSWVNQRYKLISKNGGATFELYDLLADREERTNVAGANPEVVARMNFELSTWLAAVAADTEYVTPPDRVTVVLATGQARVDGAFDVEVVFSAGVTGLVADDFVVANGSPIALTGGGSAYTLTIDPDVPGLVTVALPAGAVADLVGEPNLASNSLPVLFAESSAADEGLLIDDHFDDAEVIGWVSQGNTRGAEHLITHADSILVSQVVPTQTNSNRGIASTAAFDPVGVGAFTATFVVAGVDQTPDANGLFLGLVDNNAVFYRDTGARNFGLTFFGTESRTNSGNGFGLNYGDNFAAAGAELRLADSHAGGDVELASFLDGFTATVGADGQGWVYEIDGLNDASGSEALFSGAGRWADVGTDFATLFARDASWHVVTSNQEAASATHTTRFERIRLAVGEEPAPPLFEFRAASQAAGARLVFGAVEGRRYQIDRTADLKSWAPLAVVTATDRFATFVDDDDAVPGFFRVRALLGE